MLVPKESESLGFPLKRDEIRQRYPVGDRVSVENSYILFAGRALALRIEGKSRLAKV